jgi:uncharacterized membrane protein
MTRLFFDLNLRWAHLALAALIALYVGTFGTLATREYLAFETGAFDLGTYDQALWNAAHGRGLALSLVPSVGPNRFAAHVEPILYLLLPFYWLRPSPLWLIWLQTLALGLAGWPLFLLARRRLESEVVALTLVAAYFLLPATEAVNMFDFHAVALSPPFTLAGLYFLDLGLTRSGEGGGLWRWPKAAAPLPDKRPDQVTSAGRAYLSSALFFLLALSTKEDVSLHVFVIGVYVILVAGRWRPGLVLALAGLAWFYVAFYLVIPANRGDAGQTSAYVGLYENLGETPLEIALSPLRQPGQVLAILISPENVREWRAVLAPFGFVGLAGLPFLLLAGPTLAITMLSRSPLLHQLETWHYAAPMLPFVVLAAVDGLARLFYVIERALSKIQMTNDKIQNPKARVKGLSFLISNGQWVRGLKFSMQRGRHSPIRRSPLAWLMVWVLLSALIYHHYRGYSPLARPFHWPQLTAHHALGRALAAQIPPEASVLAQAELVPQVSQRQLVRIWEGPLETDFEYIFLDVAHPSFTNRDNAQGDLLAGLAIEPAFGLVESTDGYLLLQGGRPRLPTSEAFQNFLFVSPQAVTPNTSFVFADEIELIAVDTFWARQADENVNEPQLILTFRVLAEPAADYRLILFRVDDTGRLVGATQNQPPALVWWPTGRWQPGTLIQVRATPFWWTGEVRTWGYALGFVRGEDPWDVTARLPVTASAAPGLVSEAENLALVAGFRRVLGIPYADERVRLRLAALW